MMQFYIEDRLMIGITQGNINRLKDNKPMRVKCMKDISEILIIYGETKPKILDYLASQGQTIPTWMREAAEKDPE